MKILLQIKNVKYVFVALLAFMSIWLKAQPTVFYTSSSADPVSGFTISNSRILLVDRGAFRQVIFQNKTANQNKNWAFHIGTQTSLDYSKNWRPYQTGSANITVNTITAPNTTNPGTGALYNTGSGGQDGNWDGFNNNDYVIVNVTENASTNNHMAVWQTSYLPNTLSGASHTAGSTTLTLGSALAAGENMYVRASTNGFATSEINQVTFSLGTTGTFSIPSTICSGSDRNVSYYFYTSKQSLADINTAVSTHGQLAHDMVAFYLLNNGGNNYSTTLASITAIGSNSPVCANATLNLTSTTTGSGTLTYLWSGMGTFSDNTIANPSVTSPTTGTYSLSVTGTGGCSVNSSTSVTINSLVTPTFNAIAPICSGASLSALPTTSTNSITGSWSPALNNTTTTTYTFTPNSGQCATTTTLTITVNPNPTAFNMTGGGSYCAGGSGVPVGLAGSQSGVSYQLKRDGMDVGSSMSGTGSSLSFSNQTAAGTYTVVAAALSCTATMTGSVSITTPVTPSVSIAASPSNIICAGTSVTFTATPSNVSGGTVNYNFKVGGMSQQNGALSNYASSALANGNVVSCDITISGGCVSSNLATSNGITMDVSADCTPRLNAKVFIEGAYNSNTGLMNDGLFVNNKIPTNQPYNTLSFSGVNYNGTEMISQSVSLNQGGDVIVDWVLIELRNATTPSIIVAKRAALLQSDGDIVDTDGSLPLAFTGVATGTYHVVIRHRLCLSTRTATAVSFPNGTAISLDFTNNPNVLSGSMKNLGSGVYALYSGDTDRDGDIDAVDLANIRGWNPTPLSYFNYGGKSYDMDFNGEIYSTDILYVKINSGISQINLN
jgi:hypothetical protein